MKRMLLIACLLMFFSFAHASKIYVLHLVIDKNDTVGLLGFNVSEGAVDVFPSPMVPKENYTLNIISKDNRGLFSQRLDISFVNPALFMGPNATIPADGYVDQEEHIWNLPYYKDAAFIQLFHDDRKIFEYELPQQVTEEPGLPEKPDEEPLDTNIIICAVGGIIALALAAYALPRCASKKGEQK